MKNRIGSWMLATFVAGVVMAPFAAADAALNASITLKGQKQGFITGNSAQKGRIAVIAVSHTVVSPRDPASGLATGKRVHKPFVITKEIDRATPLLHQALVTNEVLTEVRFRVHGLLVGEVVGSELTTYTVKMTNANIGSIDTRTTADGQVVEDISFVYQKIEWEWPVEKTYGADVVKG